MSTMLDDNADLLGSKIMPVVPFQKSWLSGISNSSLLYLCTSLVLIGWWMLHGGRQYLFKWQEKHYRLQKRRKHGIPDDDRRPFNVAYAAAILRRQEREAEERAILHEEQRQNILRERTGSTHPVSDLRQRALGESSQPSSSPATGPLQRAGNTTRQYGDTRIPQRRPVLEPLNFTHRYEPRSDVTELPRSVSQVRFTRPQDSRAVPVSFRQNVVDLDADSATNERAKRVLDEDADNSSLGLSKKSRFDGEDLIDGDNDVLWVVDANSGKGKGPTSKSQRGAKRQASYVDDDDAVEPVRQKSRDKRARKVSLEKGASFPAEYVIDDEDRDQFMDMEPISRGKKRDRAEAGSTFGGDEDSPLTEGKKARRRRRKVSKEGIDSTSRGQKRSYDAERTPDSDDEDHRPREKTKRTKGKRAVLADDAKSADVSLNFSGNILKNNKGHQVGDEWEANGVRWKIDPDGQKLRQTLLRKKRTRYSMPQDSQHPDSQAQIVVVIETWLNDSQFKAAEERGELFHPNEDPKEVDPKRKDDIEDSPSKIPASPVKSQGKTLLWSSARGAGLPRKAFKDSIVTNIGVSVNPFDQPHSLYGTRVTSAQFGPKTSESPRLRSSKSYSKWEKQDLEAEGLARLRQRLEEQKKAAAAENVPFAASSSTITTTPTISLTPPTLPPLAASSEQPKNPVFSAAPAFTRASTHASTPPFPVAQSSHDVPSATQFPLLGSAEKNASQPKFASAPPLISSTSPPDAVSPAGLNIKPTEPSSAAVPNSNFFGNQSKPAAAPKNAATVEAPSSITPVPSKAPPHNFGVQPTVGPKDPPAPAPMFNFAVPSASATGNSTSMLGGMDKTVSSNETSKPGEQQGGSSLLSRLGGFGSGPAAGNANAPGPSPFFAQVPTAGPSSTPSASSGDQSKTGSNTGPSVTSIPKFNFGFNAKPVAAAPPAAQDDNNPPAPQRNPEPASSTFKFPSAPPQASGTEPTAAPKFSFGTTSQSTQPAPAPATSSSSTATPAKPKFSFGTGNLAGTGNLFAVPKPVPSSNGTPLGSTGGTANASPAVPNPPAFTGPSTFNFGSTSNTAVNAFSGVAKPAVGSTSSAFGSIAKAGDAPKPLFGFGNGNGAASPVSVTTPTAGGNEKQSFSFNFGAGASSTPSTGALGSAASGTATTSLFGVNTSGTPTNNPFAASTSTPAANPFAAGSGSASLNPFGFKPASGPPSFSFGSPAAPGSSKQ